MQKFIIKLKVNTVFNVRCYLLTIVHHSFHFTAMIDLLLTGNLPRGGFKISSFFIKKDERFLASVLWFPQNFLYCISQNHRQKERKFMVNEGVKKSHRYTISPGPPPSTSEVKWLAPYNLLISENIRNFISDRQRQLPKHNWSF